MKPTLAQDIILDALLVAIWRRRPNEPVIIDSDQGSQYSSGDWQKLCQKHNLIPSMSRRGLAQYIAHGTMLLLNLFLAV